MSVKYQDYYSVLGVDRGATQEQIQKAFRKLARKFHPDVNKAKDAEARFKEINEAYEVLGDPEKRKRYDTLGANWQAGQDFTPPPGWEQIFSQFAQGGRQQGPVQFQFGNAGGFSDFFEMLFGGQSPLEEHETFFRTASGGRAPRAGESHEAELALSLEDSYRGGMKTISLERVERDSSGRPTRRTKNYQVKIPRGVTDGSVIRLKGEGSEGASGGPAGDVLLRIRILPHSRFRLVGHDILSTISVAPWEAALGGRVAAPTLDGQVTLTIPSGSQSGQQLRLRGKGLPRQGGEPGDMLIEVKIVVPKQLTAEERELFEKLAQASTFNAREN